MERVRVRHVRVAEQQTGVDPRPAKADSVRDALVAKRLRAEGGDVTSAPLSVERNISRVGNPLPKAADHGVANILRYAILGVGGLGGTYRSGRLTSLSGACARI